MCGNFPNIKVVEGNAFSLVLPLKRRTFESCQPIDEDIDATQLTDVVVKFGGVEYTPSLGVDGVTIILPATLARGTYDIVLTAKYQGTDIRAAYEGAISIVPWNSQSDAQQFVPGSPIVCDAAYVIGGALTDEELEQLKEEYREKNAQLDQAIADAEEAKAEWEQRAAELEDVAQESTLTDGVTAIRDDISHIDIDTSTLAKETSVKDGNDTAIGVSKEIRSEVGTGSDTAAETGTLFAVVKWVKDKVKSIFNLIGTPASGQPSTLFAAIAAVGGGDDSKQTIVDAINQMGGSATTSMTWAQLATQVESLDVLAQGNVFAVGVTRPISIAYVLVSNLVTELYDEQFTGALGQVLRYAFTGATKITFKNATGIGTDAMYGRNTRRAYFPNVTNVNNTAFQANAQINIIDLSKANTLGSGCFGNCIRLIDLIVGGGFVGSINMSTTAYNPTQAYLSNTSSLCFSTDQEEYGRTFANNFEKWKWCIINHFAANLQDRTGLTAYTITFGTTILDKFDAEMTAAFTNKNWTLA